MRLKDMRAFGPGLRAGIGGLWVLCATMSPSLASELPSGAAAGDMTLSPFYRWDGAMPGHPGEPLREEAFDIPPEMDAAVDAARILYTSEDARWHSGEVPVSGTLFLPAGETPAGVWPLLSWAHGTLGIADACAPSWTGFRERDAVYMNRWLAQGFAVVATDYQGLGGPGPHPYSYWQAEGRSVLDAARAALSARSDALSGKVMIAGQSQGGGASLGAAALAGEYAPELDIVGAVVSGPNSSFPDGPVKLPPRVSSTMFLALATAGLPDDGLRIKEFLTPTGRQLLKVARQGCTRDVALKARELEVGSPLDLLAIPLDDLLRMRIPTTDQPMVSIGFPILIATGQADATIEPIRQYAVAAALCAAGNEVTWTLYDGLGHDGAMHGVLDDAFAFAGDLLAGHEAVSNCADIQPPGEPGALNPDAPFNAD